MAEELHFIQETQMRRIQRDMGMAYPTKRYLSLMFRPDWEKRTMSLPTLPDTDPIGQTETGAFRFTIGVDGLGGAPL